MSILLETTFGDLVLDLDIKGSPSLSKNILKLAKARYYTNTLLYNVLPGKYCQMGDPKGDGTGGCSIYGLIDAYQSLDDSVGRSRQQQPPDVTKSQRRFLQSQGRLLSSNELNQKGVVVAMEMGNVPHTIGSQFLITLSENNGLSDLAYGKNNSTDAEDRENNNAMRYFSLGTVAEDTQNILSKLNRAYCDDDGRPFADIRIQRALVIYDPFEDDPSGMDDLLRSRGVTVDTSNNNKIGDDDLIEGYPLAPRSPKYDKPPEEVVSTRIQADDTTLFATAGWDESQEYEEDEEEDEATRQKRLEIQEKQEEEWKKRQDKSRAVMLEMLGDLPSAEIKAPENVLFVCKLNPVTTDEDLELIFARFDSSAKAEIIRDPDTGASLQYAFVEFSTNESCNEAYLKMNNALVDDRRIRVDFSQSVAKVWSKYQKYRQGDRSGGIDRGFTDGGGGYRGGGGSRGRGRGGRGDRGRGFVGRGGPMNRGHYQEQAKMPPRPRHTDQSAEDVDDFGRRARPKDVVADYRPRSDYDNRRSFSKSPSPSRCRDEKRRPSRSRSRSRSYSRSRSRSSDSYDGRRRKKHKHRHRQERKHRSRSRSRDRDRKKKHHKHRHSRKSEKHRREYSDDDDRHHRRKHKKRDRY